MCLGDFISIQKRDRSGLLVLLNVSSCFAESMKENKNNVVFGGAITVEINPAGNRVMVCVFKWHGKSSSICGSQCH